MWLCGEEFKKILKSRLSVIVLIAIMIIQTLTILSSYKEIENKCGNINEYNTYADEYNGTLDRSFVDSNDINKMVSNVYQRSENTKEAYFYEQYLAAIVRADEYVDDSGRTTTPKFQNTIGINALVQNLTSVVSVVFALMGILFALNPIFYKDMENGMANIIYSSLFGRRSIIKAKIIASLTFGVGWISIYYFFISIFTIVLFGNEKIMNVPINCVPCLSDCNYNISVLQYLLLGYLLMLIAALFMVACIMLVYSRIRKLTTGVLIGGVLILLPMFLPKNGNIGKLFCLLPSSYGSALLIVGENLKLLLFGKNIDILTIGIIIILFLTIVLFRILKSTFWKGRVDI